MWTLIKAEVPLTQKAFLQHTPDDDTKILKNSPVNDIRDPNLENSHTC